MSFVSGSRARSVVAGRTERPDAGAVVRLRWYVGCERVEAQRVAPRGVKRLLLRPLRAELRERPPQDAYQRLPRTVGSTTAAEGFTGMNIILSGR